jgi:EAL domain-containing protein (putative c-di-GMP-specific phosphodiesterase class I)
VDRDVLDELTGDALLASAQATAGRAPPDAAPGYAFFSPEIQARARRRLEIEVAVRGALERDEFRLVYQPRVELADLQARGAEALIRWRHPQLGEVPPLEFISVAEEAGLIDAIGDWTLDRACREVAAWRRDQRRAVTVSVNVSSQQLATPRALVSSVTGALGRYGLPATALELELTESMVIHAGRELLAALNGLRELGVSVALDDFGTGYSSLGYLRKLPVDCLKIDRSFVSDLGEDPCAEGVLQAILAIARALRMRTVAEGIETVAQYRMLVDRGCLEGQGYLFSRPLEAAAFSSTLAARALPGVAALQDRTA